MLFPSACGYGIDVDQDVVRDYGGDFTPPHLARTSPCCRLGDVDRDGYVTQSDITLVEQAILGTVTLTADQVARADVNGVGLLDMGIWPGSICFGCQGPATVLFWGLRKDQGLALLNSI